MSDTPKPLPQDSRNSPVTLASLSSVLDQGIKLVGLAYGIGFVVIMTHTARLNAPVVGMAADTATGGYWLVGADGGVFSYGAPFLGAG